MTDSPKFKLIDATIGQHVVVIEPIEEEVRWWHYIRQDGEVKFSPKYVPVLAIRTVQGRPGQKPRWDSGVVSHPAEMPGASMVVDGSLINHDWTDAHRGLVVVQSAGWTGFYVNSKLVHRISPSERPYRGDEAALAETLANAFAAALDEDIAIAHATQEWTDKSRLLPDELTKMKLRMR